MDNLDKIRDNKLNQVLELPAVGGRHVERDIFATGFEKPVANLHLRFHFILVVNRTLFYFRISSKKRLE